jgi:hypothetical protein
MIAQRLGRSIKDANIEQLFDESLIDELEKEGFLRASEWSRSVAPKLAAHGVLAHRFPAANPAAAAT